MINSFHAGSCVRCHVWVPIGAGEVLRERSRESLYCRQHETGGFSDAQIFTHTAKAPGPGELTVRDFPDGSTASWKRHFWSTHK